MEHGNIIGRRYGRLIVKSLVFRDRSGSGYKCLCDCGNSKTVRRSSLTQEFTKSCGCLAKELSSLRLRGKKYSLKHGMRNTITYSSWQRMRNRCGNKNTPDFKYYGARGITVCDRWDDFINFFEDMGECPVGFSIDRIDNNNGYSPENCRWSNHHAQMNNTRMNVFIKFKGETLTISQWATRLGINKSTLSSRISKLGWTNERALTMPAR